MGTMLGTVVLLAWSAVFWYVGRLVGGHCPLWVRLMIALPAVFLGLRLCLSGDLHSNYRLTFVYPLAVYAIGSVDGLLKRAQARKMRFWEQHHMDWMLLLGAALTFLLMYVTPSA